MNRAMKRHAPNLAPRLLDKGQAAAYLGMCAAVFETVCKVSPIEIKQGMRRWDLADLDAWVEARKTSPSGGSLADQFDEWHQHSRKRN